MRFFLLSVLLLISAAILSKLPPFNVPIGSSEEVTITPAHAPKAPKAPTPPKSGTHEPIVKYEKKTSGGRDVTISIDKDGVRITLEQEAVDERARISLVSVRDDVADL